MAQEIKEAQDQVLRQAWNENALQDEWYNKWIETVYANGETKVKNLVKPDVRRSSKFLKPQVKYLLKMIDEDIQQQKKFLAHMDEWMERTKPTDKYYERQVNATHKKISFAEQCREKILNFA